MLSGSSGCFALLLYKPEIGKLQHGSMANNAGFEALAAVHSLSQGTRAAIVSSAASCTVVPLWTHVLTGPVASITSSWIEAALQRYGLQDNSSLVSVHLGGGALGVIAVGIFAHQVHGLTYVSTVFCCKVETPVKGKNPNRTT